MALELKPPYRLQNINTSATKIFLAGSIEMGKAEPWQETVVNAFTDSTNAIFFNPRRTDWDSSWKQDPTPGTNFHGQVTWELDHIEKADIIVFYFDPKTQSPITLLELGKCLGEKKKILVACPDGYFRKGNVVITCKRNDVDVLNSLSEVISKLKKILK